MTMPHSIPTRPSLVRSSPSQGETVARHDPAGATKAGPSLLPPAMGRRSFRSVFLPPDSGRHLTVSASACAGRIFGQEIAA